MHGFLPKQLLMFRVKKALCAKKRKIVQLSEFKGKNIDWRGDPMKYVQGIEYQKTCRKVSVILFMMLCWISVSMADINHHPHAPTFSNPEEFAPVPDGWESRPIEYLEKHKGSDLVVALGQQSYPLFHELIQEYAKTNNLKIVVEQGTCGITSGRLLKKKVDVGAFCCPPSKTDRFPGIEFHSLGISAIALVVHPDNTLTDVSTEQAKQLFNGQIARWSELGPDSNQLIQPVGRLHCKTRPGHWRSLLKSGDDFSPRLFEVGVIPDMISQVSRNVRSIGWETPLMVDYHQKKGKVKMLFIDGKSPTNIENLARGNYPLYRSYTLTAWTADSDKSRQAKKLIRFLQQYVEKIHRDIGFIPASQLRDYGWKFKGDELIGEPDNI